MEESTPPAQKVMEASRVIDFFIKGRYVSRAPETTVTLRRVGRDGGEAAWR